MKTRLLLFLFIIFLNHTYAQSFSWARSVGAYCQPVATNAAGHVFTAGIFSGIVDFDPGPGTFTLGSGSFNQGTFISESDANENFITASCISLLSGQGYVTQSDMKIDNAGNIYIAGTFLTYMGSTIDFDPGPGTNTLTSYSNLHFCFILKLDASGNFVWVKTFDGSSGNSEGASLAIDVAGNVLVTGNYKGTIDFDPGVGTSLLSGSGNIQNAFVVKLDAAGNFTYVKQVAGTANSLPASMTSDGSGDIYITGKYQGTSDFDPGAAVYSLASLGGDDVFVLKLSSSGNFAWAKSIGGTGNNYATDIAVDASGNSHLTGASSGTADFDPGAGVFNLSSVGPADFFVLKLDANGNFAWVKTGGSSTSFPQQKTEGMSVDVDAGGNIYTVGAFSGSAPVDFDSGPGTYFLSAVPTASWSSFISRLDASGNFLWAGTMGGGEGRSVAVRGSDVYISGIFIDPIDIDPTAGTYSLAGSSDGFILKLNFDLSINGQSSFCSGTGSATASYFVPQESGSTYSWMVSPGVILNSPANTSSVNVTFTSASATLTAVVSNTSPVSNTASLAVHINATPSVSIAALPSLTVCAGSTLSMSGTGAATYTWSAGVTNNNPFAPAVSANHTVTGTSAAGCTASKTVAVVVYTLPVVNAIASPSSVVCNGSSLTLSGTGAVTYTWNGGIVDNTPFVVISTNPNTLYVVTGTGNNGCKSTTAIPITVKALPAVGFAGSPSQTVCTGAVLLMNGTGASTYTWSGGIINNSFLTVTASAIYTLSGMGPTGCTNTATLSVTANPLPTVGATVMPSNTVCSGATLTQGGTGASTYTWSGGIINNSSFTPVSTSVYTVSGTDANGCKNTATVAITVNPLPVLGFVSMPSLSVCAGSLLNLSGTGALIYSWSGGINNGVAFVPAATTTYSLNATDINGCSNTLTVTAVVNARPYFMSQPISQTVAVNTTTQFAVMASNMGSNFQWQQDTGQGFINLSNTGQVSGVNTATLILLNANLLQNNTDFRCIIADGNCSDTSLIATLTVYLETGIKERAGEDHFTLSPNPAKNSCTVYVHNAWVGVASYTITDGTGRLVLQGNIENAFTELDISTLVEGLYFVHLNHGYQKSLKLIKQ